MLEGRLTRQLIISLLNHIRSFSDWAQCFVLELVATYQPASEEERFDILEVRWMGPGGSVARGVWWRLFGWLRGCAGRFSPREAVAGQGRHCSRWSAACQNYTIGLPFCHRPQVLDFGLHHANSAVVMATAKLFLHYTMAFNSQHQQVRLRCCGVATACYALLGGWLPPLLPPTMPLAQPMPPHSSPLACLSCSGPCLPSPLASWPVCAPWQVLETLKDPLQTLIQGREAEVVYAVLSNFLVLAQRYPLIFSQVGWVGSRGGMWEWLPGCRVWHPCVAFRCPTRVLGAI